MRAGAVGKRRRWVLGLSAFLLALSSLGAGSANEGVPPSPLVVFLVRHAEKSAVEVDPGLTPEGRARADRLASVLRDAGIEQVHSSDYRRTRDTARPVARMLGIDVGLYDSRDLPTLVERMRAAGGRHLVVGHSNTTPSLVSLLGGDPGEPIEEAREYDRLYVVRVGARGPVETILLRYGAPAEPGSRH